MRSAIELVEIIDSYLSGKKLSRRQFSVLIDIPNSTIASWKTKNILPSVEFVAKVAKFMNVSLDWLVFGEMLEKDIATGEDEKKHKINSIVSGIELVDKIDKLIEEKGISRRQLCADVGISNSTIATWKTKNILPTAKLIAMVAIELNVSIDWLLNGRDFNNLIFDTHLYELAKKYKKILLILDKIIEEEIILRNNP